MGKNLVIKFADFSENGFSTSISWILGYTNTQLHGERTAYGSSIYVVAPETLGTLGLSEKTIKYVKVYSPNAGMIEVHTCSTSSFPYTSTSSQSYNVFVGNNIIELTAPITLSSNISIGIKGPDCFTYWRASVSGHAGWTYYLAGSTQDISTAQLPIDFGESV